MSAQPGLRERKKQQTKTVISETARQLFAERGFDAVTVAEIARAADVSEGTVFNYFPTKEDLVYGGLEAFEEALLGAIRDRPSGESVISAFERFVLTPRGLLVSKDPKTSETLLGITRAIADSPPLLAREREIYERFTHSLAQLLAEERGSASATIEPWVAANALIGVHRALVDYVRRQLLAGQTPARVTRDMRAQGERALAVLAQGLKNAGY
jgi:AcrR family transcriptional regulator